MSGTIVKNKYNLEFNPNGPRQQSIKCPFDGCASRKKKNLKPLSVDLDKGVFNCHHCGKSGLIDGYEPKKDKTYQRPARIGWEALKPEVQNYLFSRGFSIDTIKRNQLIQKTFIDNDETPPIQRVFIGYPYFRAGEKEVCNLKWRCATEKLFKQEYNAYPVMYNLQMWAESNEVIISEGENDVMAWNEAGFWNATTTNGGAINANDKNVDGKLESLYNCFEFFENKKVIYLALDNDVPGIRLRDELIRKLGAARCRLVEFPKGKKDPNDVLLMHGLSNIQAGREELAKCLRQAKEVPISGVYYIQDHKDLMIETFREGVPMGESTHFGSFDSLFLWKKGQVNLWTGYMNHGKTTFFLQLALTKSIFDGWKWAIFSPENFPATEFYDDLIEMYVGRHVDDRYHNKMTEAQYIDALGFINDHFFFVYPSDRHTVENLHDTFQQLNMKHGIDGVLIDPHNQLESSFPGKRTDEEISEFMRVVKRFTVEMHISYNIVAHPKNPQKSKDSKDMPPPDARDINGGAMWGNKADNIIIVHRPKWYISRQDQTVEVIIEKIKRVRTGGKRGEMLFAFDFMKARYQEGGIYFCDPKKAMKEADRSIQLEIIAPGTDYDDPGKGTNPPAVIAPRLVEGPEDFTTDSDSYLPF